MKRVTKKILNKLFGSGPVRVRSFFELYPQDEHTVIDLEETLTAVLLHEKDNVNHYEKLQTANQNPILRPLRYKDGGIFKAQDRYVFSVKDGCIFGSDGVIYDAAKRTAVSESSSNWFTPLAKHDLLSAVKLAYPEKMNGTALSLCTTGADGGFYHFFIESLPKLFMCAPIIKKIDYFLVPGEESAWKLKWLTYAGIAKDKIIWLHNFGHYQFDQLIFTNRLIKDQQISLWGIKALHSLFNFQPAVKKHNAIYISRRNESTRNLKWEEMLLQEFPEIQVYDSSALSVTETMAAIANADLIVSPHGAGLSNIVFGQSPATIIELYPLGKTYQPCYQRMANLLNLDHIAVWIDFDDPGNEYGLQFLTPVIRKYIESGT